MRYVVLGNGWLGNIISSGLKAPICDKRIYFFRDVEQVIKDYSPDVIINCIGKTGRPNIDWCEVHKAETEFSNEMVPETIAMACQANNVKLVHLSTGCVFEGDNKGKGWSETDTPLLLNWYVLTKMAGERKVLDACPESVVLRIRMPISSIPHPRNFLTKILSYPKLISEWNSFSFVEDLPEIIRVLIEKGEKGVFNVVAKNSMTHKDIIGLYERVKGKSLNKLWVNDLSGLAIARRSNCVLSTIKLEKVMMVPDVSVRMFEAIKEYVKNE